MFCVRIRLLFQQKCCTSWHSRKSSNRRNTSGSHLSVVILLIFLSIDRVFRNETLDATHLAEFHQVEGLIADYDVSLADLIGVLNTFFQKLGIKKLKFKVIIYIKLKILPLSACFQPIHGTLNGDLLVS